MSSIIRDKSGRVKKVSDDLKDKVKVGENLSDKEAKKITQAQKEINRGGSSADPKRVSAREYLKNRKSSGSSDKVSKSYVVIGVQSSPGKPDEYKSVKVNQEEAKKLSELQSKYKQRAILTEQEENYRAEFKAVEPSSQSSSTDELLYTPAPLSLLNPEKIEIKQNYPEFIYNQPGPSRVPRGALDYKPTGRIIGTVSQAPPKNKDLTVIAKTQLQTIQSTVQKAQSGDATTKERVSQFATLGKAAGVYGASQVAIIGQDAASIIKNPLSLFTAPIDLAADLTKNPQGTLAAIKSDLSVNLPARAIELYVGAKGPKYVANRVKASNALAEANARVVAAERILSENPVKIDNNPFVVSKDTSLLSDVDFVSAKNFQSNLKGQLLTDEAVKASQVSQKVLAGVDDTGKPIYVDAREFRLVTEVPEGEFIVNSDGKYYLDRFKTDTSLVRQEIIQKASQPTVYDVFEDRFFKVDPRGIPDLLSSEPGRFKLVPQTNLKAAKIKADALDVINSNELISDLPGAEGYFSPNTPTNIYIKPGLKPKEFSNVVAHERGHLFDEYINKGTQSYFSEYLRLLPSANKEVRALQKASLIENKKFFNLYEDFQKPHEYTAEILKARQLNPEKFKELAPELSKTIDSLSTKFELNIVGKGEIKTPSFQAPKETQTKLFAELVPGSIYASELITDFFTKRKLIGSSIKPSGSVIEPAPVPLTRFNVIGPAVASGLLSSQSQSQGQQGIQIQQPKSFLEDVQVSQLKLEGKTDVYTLQKQQQDVVGDVAVITKSKAKSAQALFTETKQVTAQEPVQIIKPVIDEPQRIIRFRSVTETVNPRITPFVAVPPVKSVKLPSSSSIFTAYTIQGGKVVKFPRLFESEGEAARSILDFVRRTPRASAAVKQGGSFVNLARYAPVDFSPSKSKAGFFVEKPSTRINEREELLGITYKGLFGRSQSKKIKKLFGG